VKLLFDQNLSPRLPGLLSDLYPASAHVREVGLRDATDAAIWKYASEHGFVIASKDSDFQQHSLLLGHPPKFIWLRVGNCSARHVHEVLRKYAAVIDAFEESVRESHLMLP
jgi:predicted nuclease of predicted toxin-antitoxin system